MSGLAQMVSSIFVTIEEFAVFIPKLEFGFGDAIIDDLFDCDYFIRHHEEFSLYQGLDRNVLPYAAPIVLSLYRV